jgi:hypothetical protein
MVYCNLKGGIGNMLFQIAATLEYSNIMNVGCSFPNLNSHLSLLKNETKHNPNLNSINHYLDFLNSFKTSAPPAGTPIVRFPFSYENLKIPIPCIIDGFFQSEKYFINTRKKIQDLFNTGNRKINKVSIHVRRGDYLDNPNYHTVLDLGYYKRSIGLFTNKSFLIFSDDLDWCKRNFIGKEFSFMDKGNDLQQIMMMSMCEDNIIANSSFSWWGAWLNKNEEKKIIAPKNWFGPLANLETKDIYCDNWIIL